MDKFESFYILKRNVTYERYKFFTFTQRAGETIDQYVTELRHQSKTCKFGELIDSLINDRIVCGILDNGLRERLLRGQDLDMEKALMLCKASEIVALQAKELFIENCKVDTVRKCKHIRKNNKTTTKTTESKTSSERKKLCDCLWTAALTKTGSGVWKNWQQLCFINCAFHIEPQTWNPNNPCHDAWPLSILYTVWVPQEYIKALSAAQVQTEQNNNRQRIPRETYLFNVAAETTSNLQLGSCNCRAATSMFNPAQMESMKGADQFQTRDHSLQSPVQMPLHDHVSGDGICSIFFDLARPHVSSWMK
ncbi:uncharacterized protein LOC132393194 isoform X1 [Hypanus sabinus]|uniref:uncharacterized protein LOC132393194 isoform X1 n=1 Tax=Hypanus sabinus TaxID=79690 RepID=UPI0028C3F2F0|nr:uncharacterized protein LOC132393194 isoform X1 [Hypanus sabinus]XP_059824117.1 uncharacterized protein LOC132393194 isoform X1 [Hypanus sabinus]XP_059824118.1 uncharacterized protein LOC132393194 isoform X1 [Hypanus sabinus]XP_059824119.1 uncharacterized protein LOC132393194 isoform X1 [Hypanus sabinus]